MKHRQSKHALIAGVSGNALQWYDFTLFGYFTPIVAQTYFPHQSQIAGMLSAFTVFAVGYLLAPLGSIFFGYLGDRHGRKYALTTSILLMAIATVLIGLLPGYKTLSLIAPILITLLRMSQGFVASAEFAGSAIFLAEHAREGRKTFYACLTSSAYSLGSIAAGLMASLLTADHMPTWAWRMGFGLSLVGALIVLYLRVKVDETPDFAAIERQRLSQSPLSSAIKNAPLAMLAVVGIAWFVGIITFGSYVFMVSYLHVYFKLSLSQVTSLVTLALLVDALLEPLIALLADTVGQLPLIRVGIIAMLIFSLPLFHLIKSGYIYFAVIGLSCLIAITYAPLNAYMVSLFASEYRYTGFGLSFNIGVALFGGSTPLVMAYLVEKTQLLASPAWYYVVGAVVALASLSLAEYHRRSKNAETVDHNFSVHEPI